MARWKSIEKNGVLERVPQDAAAHLEVVENDYREGRLDGDGYRRKKAEIERLFADNKESDNKAESARVSSQQKAREAVLSSQAAKKKASIVAAVARSVEKSSRKGSFTFKGGK